VRATTQLASLRAGFLVTVATIDLDGEDVADGPVGLAVKDAMANRLWLPGAAYTALTS
jgi:hypothetical protein